MVFKTRPSKQCEFCIYLHDNYLGLPEWFSWSGWSGWSGGLGGPGGQGSPCGQGGPGGPGGPGCQCGPSGGQGEPGGPGVSGHLTYRHLTYTGVCRSYVRFVQKKQTYDLQTPVILVMNSVGVMSICEVLSRLKSLKKLSPPPP